MKERKTKGKRGGGKTEEGKIGSLRGKGIGDGETKEEGYGKGEGIGKFESVEGSSLDEREGVGSTRKRGIMRRRRMGRLKMTEIRRRKAKCYKGEI